MSNTEQRKSQTIVAASKNLIRELTVAEREAVSGAGTPGMPQPDQCTCPKPTS
jgi:hypothetical protein